MQDIILEGEDGKADDAELMVNELTLVEGKEPVKPIRRMKDKFKRKGPSIKYRKPLRRRYLTKSPLVNEKNMKDLAQEPSPFRYPDDFESFAHNVMRKAWRDDIRVKELQIKCFDKPNYKGRTRQDLLNRLYVEDAPAELQILEDREWDILKGRPVPDRLNVRQYIQTIRNALRTKIVHGYREDDIMLIEEKIVLEQRMIEEIRHNLQNYVQIFENFLYRNHAHSMDLLKASDKASEEANEAYQEYKTLTGKYGAMRSVIYISDEKWRNCLMYQKFLFLMSPLTWRQEHPNACPTLPEDITEGDVFEEFRSANTDGNMSLTDIVNGFMAQYKVSEPEIFFTHPNQLIQVFRFMEEQNMNSLLHIEELAGPLDLVKYGMMHAEELFNTEINNLQEAITSLEDRIRWEENRVAYLENLAKEMIDGEFKKLICDDKVLNLHVFVEDVYETRVAPNDANLSMTDMMKEISMKFYAETLALDKIPSEIVTQLEGSCIMEQAQMMKLAEKAAKQVAELEKVTHNLKRAFGPPPPPQKGKKLVNRSNLWEKKKQEKQAARPLTEEELEHLEYFTDFCKYTDDPETYRKKLEGDAGTEDHDQGTFVEGAKPKFVHKVKGIEKYQRMIASNV